MCVSARFTFGATPRLAFGGLIVAVILQLFYNYLIAKIDSLVNSMEDASISLVDILVKHNLSK